MTNVIKFKGPSRGMKDLADEINMREYETFMAGYEVERALQAQLDEISNHLYMTNELLRRVLKEVRK